MKETPYLLDSLTRGIDVIHLLAQLRDEPVSLAELSRQARINKTTVLRILRTLEHKGWAVQTAPGQFRLAVRFVENRLRRIGYSSRDNRLSFPGAVTASIQRTAAENGVGILSLDNRSSNAQTIRNAERMIRERVDCAVVFQAESTTGAELSSLFNESAIPLISIDMAVAGASYFGADNYSAGLSAGRAMARALTETGRDRVEEILLVGNLQFGSLPAARLNGFLKAFEKHYRHFAGIAVSALDSRGSFETGIRLLRKKMRTTQRRNGMVVCVSDPLAMGAIPAIEEAGRAKGWLVWSFGGAPDVRMELRRSGSPLVGVVGFGPEQYGPQIWKMVSSLMEGQPSQPAIFAKMKVLTRDNIDSLYPHDLELMGSPTRT